MDNDDEHVVVPIEDVNAVELVHVLLTTISGAPNEAEGISVDAAEPIDKVEDAEHVLCTTIDDAVDDEDDP